MSGSAGSIATLRGLDALASVALCDANSIIQNEPNFGTYHNYHTLFLINMYEFCIAMLIKIDPSMYIGFPQLGFTRLYVYKTYFISVYRFLI